MTFDVVDRAGDYVGGIIAPGLAAMTDYLHEKTALLPRIRIREVRSVIGKSTEQGMLVGAVHGYRGLHQIRSKVERVPLQETSILGDAAAQYRTMDFWAGAPRNG